MRFSPTPLSTQAIARFPERRKVDTGAWAPDYVYRRARSLASATLAGFIGHQDARVGDWVPQMAFRFDCRDVGAADLFEHWVRPNPRRTVDVAIYVHGLLIDESNWNVGKRPITETLYTHFGWVPLAVRYNTGLHVSDNGASLARLIQSLADVWGDRLGRIQLIGHSMGGLVSRSALALLQRRGAPVLAQIDRLFLFATPNSGAEIEVAGHFIEYALKMIQELPSAYAKSALRGGPALGARLPKRDPVDLLLGTLAFGPRQVVRAFENLIAMRSDGIRDVRYGYMQESEWRSAEYDGFALLANHRRPLPPPPNVTVYALAGSLWPEAGGPPSRLRNDGVVTVASVACKAGDFDDLGVVEAGRFKEIPLLMHQLIPGSPRVQAQIIAWVEGEDR